MTASSSSSPSPLLPPPLTSFLRALLHLYLPARQLQHTANKNYKFSHQLASKMSFLASNQVPPENSQSTPYHHFHFTPDQGNLPSRCSSQTPLGNPVQFEPEPMPTSLLRISFPLQPCKAPLLFCKAGVLLSPALPAPDTSACYLQPAGLQPSTRDHTRPGQTTSTRKILDN